MPKKASNSKRAAPKSAPKSGTRKAKASAKRPEKAAPKARTSSSARKGSPPPRADYGAPIDGFFAKQPAPLRAILEELRKMIEEAAPGAESALKWGMPFFMLDGEMLCALGGHKAHVNLILPGPPGTYADPAGLLSGEGKTGRRLVIESLDELPRSTVRGWLRSAVARVRKSK